MAVEVSLCNAGIVLDLSGRHKWKIAVWLKIAFDRYPPNDSCKYRSSRNWSLAIGLGLMHARWREKARRWKGRLLKKLLQTGERHGRVTG